MLPFQDGHLASVQRRRSKAQAFAAYARTKWLRRQRAAASPVLSKYKYTPRHRDARKPLSEVQERGDIRHDAGLPSKTCTNCGAVNYACLSYAADPERFWCCDGGSTVLPPLGDYPALLKALLTETALTNASGVKRSPRSVAFHSRIRQYNNAFAFTSLGVSFDERMLRATEGVYTFRIYGALYH